MKKIYKFEVECVGCGQRKAYGDSYYHYIVKNLCDIDYADSVIKNFCTGFLRKAYEPEHMPSPFHGKITSFKKLSDRTWEYKTEEMYTG